MYPKKFLWLLFLLMTILKWILPDHNTSTKACVQVSMHTPSVFTEIAEEFDAWWHHQMETFSALLAICAGNSPVPGEFPTQMPVTRSFDVFFDLRLNKWLSKQSWDWWFETLSCPLWRHCNGTWSHPPFAWDYILRASKLSFHGILFLYALQ